MINILDDCEKRQKLRFATFIIPEFAHSYKMNKQEAYLYLKKYGGLDFIFEHWWALHTDNPFWAVRDIYEVCRQNSALDKQEKGLKRLILPELPDIQNHALFGKQNPDRD